LLVAALAGVAAADVDVWFAPLPVVVVVTTTVTACLFLCLDCANPMVAAITKASATAIFFMDVGPPRTPFVLPA
jgi:hypothetical protein